MKYLRVTVNGVRKLAHIAAWESVNGPIPKGCVIHHINGDKTDNRIDNLMMMTRSEHTAMHTTRYFCNETNRIKQSDTQRKVHNTPEMLSAHSLASRKVWERPGYREKRIKSQTGKRRSDAVRAHMKEVFNSPLTKKRQSDAQKRRWARMTPEEYEQARERLRKARTIWIGRRIQMAEAK